MPIIPCRECSHQVSDQAASCPSCGAPLAQRVKIKSPTRQRISRVLVALLALWTLGTVLWLVQPGWLQGQLLTRARLTLHRLDLSMGGVPTAQHANTTAPPRSLQANTNAPAASVPTQPSPLVRTVYRTTAEELYRDYEANAVATQSRIGTSRVRLNGTVDAIDQDATGHPVVRLSTGKDSAVAMTLAEDQRTAAAQLYKGEAVDLDCDKIGGDPVLEGSGCSLVFVDPRTREVNLALFLTNDSGAAHVYVVGPMPEAVCRAHSEEISSRLREKQGNEHLLWRSCTDSGRENVLPGGCRLNASSVTLPDVPTAHVWRYDCGSSGVTRTASRRHARASHAMLATTVEPDATEEPMQPAAGATAIVGNPVAPATGHGATGNLRFASAGGGADIGAPKAGAAQETTVAHAAGSQTTAATDDLAQIRAMDPPAANHIVGYCSKAISSPANRDVLMAECRRNEAAAWTRLVLQNEFPTLSEAARQKCSEPPFPDTYVAKEKCARYELHAN